MVISKNRTKREIVESLLRLSHTRPLASIHVTEICHEAEISRQTFYEYFKDKYDVAQFYLSQLLEDNFDRLGQDIGWRKAYLNEFENIESAVRQHPAALANLFADSADYNSVINSASRTAAEDFATCFLRRHGSRPNELIAFQIKEFAREASLASTDWIKSSCAPTASVFVDMFITLIPHELFSALDVS